MIDGKHLILDHPVGMTKPNGSTNPTTCHPERSRKSREADFLRSRRTPTDLHPPWAQKVFTQELQSWDDSHTFEIEALINERTQPESEKLATQTRAHYDSLTPAGQNESEAWSKFAESESANSLGEPPVSHIAPPKMKFGNRWEFLWFALHLATVYVLVKFATPWLAGWTYGKLLPSSPDTHECKCVRDSSSPMYSCLALPPRY